LCSLPSVTLELPASGISPWHGGWTHELLISIGAVDGEENVKGEEDEKEASKLYAKYLLLNFSKNPTFYE
jgi:hypothetical protein